MTRRVAVFSLEVGAPGDGESGDWSALAYNGKVYTDPDPVVAIGRAGLDAVRAKLEAGQFLRLEDERFRELAQVMPEAER